MLEIELFCKCIQLFYFRFKYVVRMREHPHNLVSKSIGNSLNNFKINRSFHDILLGFLRLLRSGYIGYNAM